MKFTRFSDIPQLTRWGNYAVDIPLDYLPKQIQNYTDDGLVMCPDFQRGHVWTEHQQIAYVEYLLRGGLSGRDMFFNCPSWHQTVPAGTYDEFVCVDGLQRTTAILRFVNDELKVFGSKFSEYTDSMRMSMQTVRIHVNDLPSRADVLRWYIEMNAGGTPHTKEEISRVKDMLNSEILKEERKK